MCTIILTLALASMNCPARRPSAVESARILEQSPALSNRTHVYVPSVEDRRHVVFIPPHVAPSTPIEHSTEQSRANRMGSPGGWTALEWAILHSEGRK
jgi:hypothetical protein